ncbi:MAG: tetratricopeptide repeat protein [Acidimicrobiia bacterium]
MNDASDILMVAVDNERRTGRLVESLQARREFLLRSLEDLDVERAAGELSDQRYRALHDSYTAQAAAVLRALDRAESANVEASTGQGVTGRRRQRAVFAAAGLAVIGSGAILLTGALSDREPGQTITGNAQSAGSSLDVLADQAASRPDDVDAQLAYARALLAADRVVDALRAYDAAALADPDNPEALAYGGWIVFLAGLTDDALERIDAAVTADPTYPDGHFFRGMVLLRGRSDTAGALTELREYLRLAPPGPDRDRVESMVAELERATAPGT